MGIRAKARETSEFSPQAEMTFDNRLELLKYMSEVQSRIKGDISSDFVFAKLGEKDKEGVIELTTDAYFCKKVIQMSKRRAVHWSWDRSHKAWVRGELPAQMSATMDEYANAIFDAFMSRIYMTVILNRNVAENHIVRVLAGDDPDEQKEKEQAADPKGVEAFMEKVRRLGSGDD